MRWISIQEASKLIKRGLYRFETGANKGDKLIYDRRSGQYVGHIENGVFHQDRRYIVPEHIIIELDELNTGDWDSGSSW